MNKRLAISDIRLKNNGELNPLIVEFQNGGITCDISEFEARFFTHTELDNKTVEVLSKNGQKLVNPMICTSVDRFVAIKNKKSNKVKLIQVEFTNLINQPKTKETEVFVKEINAQEQNKKLKKTFGTKKAVRMLKESELLKVDKSLVEDQISEILSDPKINESSLITINEDDNAVKLIPPCNRNAKTLEEVYNINDCLSQEELITLESIAKEILQEKYDSAKCTDFFNTFLKIILNTDGGHLKKICCLLYASALINYVKAPARSLRKVASSLCPQSEMISNKIITEFSVKIGPLINRPLAMKDKAICYVIVLLAIASDFKIDLEILAKQAAYGFKKIKHLGRLVGLLPESKNSSTYILKLPLPPPLKMVKSFQKKM